KVEISFVMHVYQEAGGKSFVQFVESAFSRRGDTCFLFPQSKFVADKGKSSLHLNEHAQRQRHTESDPVQLLSKLLRRFHGRIESAEILLDLGGGEPKVVNPLDLHPITAKRASPRIFAPGNDTDVRREATRHQYQHGFAPVAHPNQQAA